MAQTSSCLSGGRIWAGLPTAVQFSGTVAPSGSMVLMWTMPLTCTSALQPTRAPLKTVAPVAKKASSSTVQPTR
jgi:hypothetical protein